jgi:hypothetical protein
MDGRLHVPATLLSLQEPAASLVVSEGDLNPLKKESSFSVENLTTSVDSWPLTTGVPVQSTATQCVICGEETDNRTDFSPSNSVVLLVISTIAS